MNAKRCAPVLLALAVAAGLPSAAAAQKYGGTLRVLLTGNPSSLSIHDEAPTNATVALSGVYNNLVYQDPFKARETLETIVPELAESWSWSADGRALTFRLRQGVTWHDGKPFTSGDVKRTFDVVRGVAPERLKLNPRRVWYANVVEIVTGGDHAVTFRLGRPQPSLVAMLGAGVSPVMPAHLPVGAWRTKALGTGPFTLKEYARDRVVYLVKNPNYWVPGRPYLDAVQHNVIAARSSQVAAFLAKQLDIVTVVAAVKANMETIQRTTDKVVFQTTTTTSNHYVMFNAKRPPFDNPRLREALSWALDRSDHAKTVLRGAVDLAGALVPPPTGAWGMTREQLVTLPGYGDPAKSKAEARRIMRELGYGPEKPLRVEILTSTLTFFVDSAIWTASTLKDVFVEATVRQMEPGVFYGHLSRREYQMVVYVYANATDDPDITFYEHFGCGSLRNYNDYCNPALQQKFDEQAQLFDNTARVKLVREIDAQLVTDVARALMGFYISYYPAWPHVKNYIPHQSAYNTWRLQEVWLDR